jgi:hypothetical protein
LFLNNPHFLLVHPTTVFQMEKYLLYQPVGGLNNQYLGFIEALHIGKILNRTVIIPHVSSQHDQPILGPITDHCTVSENSPFSLIHTKDFLNKFPSKKFPNLFCLELTYRPEFYFDQFIDKFPGIKATVKDLAYYKHFNIQFENEINIKLDNVQTEEKIFELFEKVEDEVLSLNFLFNVMDYSMEEKRLQITLNVQPNPKYILEADKFFNSLKDQKYVSIHFRRGDFQIYKDFYHQDSENFTKLFIVDFESIWPSVELCSEIIKEKLIELDLKCLFLASNLSSKDDEIIEFKKIFQDSLVRFDEKEENFNSIELAMIDMILCSRAVSFIGNIGSTFSKTISLWRRNNNLETVYW